MVQDRYETNYKQEAYKDNDQDKYRQARYAAEKAIKTAKANYRDKLEENLTTNNPRYIWQGLKAITNYKPSSKSADITDTTLPDNLNDFYSHFDLLLDHASKFSLCNIFWPKFTIPVLFLLNKITRLLETCVGSVYADIN